MTDLSQTELSQQKTILESWRSLAQDELQARAREIQEDPDIPTQMKALAISEVMRDPIVLHWIGRIDARLAEIQ